MSKIQTLKSYRDEWRHATGVERVMHAYNVHCAALQVLADGRSSRSTRIYATSSMEEVRPDIERHKMGQSS